MWKATRETAKHNDMGYAEVTSLTLHVFYFISTAPENISYLNVFRHFYSLMCLVPSHITHLLDSCTRYLYLNCVHCHSRGLVAEQSVAVSSSVMLVFVQKAGSGDCLLELLCRRSHILGPGDVCLPEIARTSAVAWGNSLLAGDGGWNMPTCIAG